MRLTRVHKRDHSSRHAPDPQVHAMYLSSYGIEAACFNVDLSRLRLRSLYPRHSRLYPRRSSCGP